MYINLKFILLTIIGLIIILSISFYFKNTASNIIPSNLNKPTLPPSPSLIKKSIKKSDVRCTADVRRCPNGSYVGRVAPSCSFAPCPNNSKN